MSLLGSNTQRVNVYGRRAKTRVVPCDIEQDTEQVAPPPPPKPTGWGFFSGLDMRAVIDSPRKVLAHWTPKRGAASAARSGTEAKTPNKVAPPPESPCAHRAALAPRDNTAPRPVSPTPRPASPALTTALEQLTLDDAHDDMAQLLAATHQEASHPFDECIASLVAQGSVVKVGEASYSEVYRITRPLGSAKGRPAVSVMKVIPLEGDAVVPGPAQSPVASVAREIRLTSALSPTSPEGAQFVRLQEAYVVHGTYPQRLLNAWDAFKQRDARSENPRPHVLPPSQRYALLCMDDAGTELEHTPLASWAQRAAVFWQVAYAVARVEASAAFEHRDLHLGNILVTRTPTRRTTRSMSGAQASVVPEALPASLWKAYEPRTAHIQATIIDYSLSRMTIDGTVHAYDFADTTLFEGQGDSQYDVYRTMRSLVAGDWQAFHASTNVLWLQFVAQRLLAADVPPSDNDAAEEAAYTSLLLAEQVAEDAIEQLRRAAPQRSISTRSKRRSIQRSPDAWKMRRAPHAPPVTSAAELVCATAELLDGERGAAGSV
ncbi:hypothetical protein CBS9595_001372 [Malassezia furfur]|nr:hypothetical protein CBS9595_001372 [Malassezia furfur]